MAKRIFTWGGTFSASAFGAAAGASNTGFMAVKGGTATQIIDWLEVLISGTQSNSAVAGMVVRYSSTLGATPTPLALPGTDGSMNVNATALANVVVPYFAATTAPTISNAVTLPTLQLGLNAFGGILRWNAAPTQQWTQVGNAVNSGESVLFNTNQSGYGGTTTTANAHILYEPT
jgi:hypothetical protein